MTASATTRQADPIGRIMRLAKDLAGIDLTEAKRTMVEARLGKRLRKLDISLKDYADKVVSDPVEQTVLLDLLTTNHTAWLREESHFADLAKRVVPWAAERQKNAARPAFRLWCAAAATGEEPWTLAMTLGRSLPNPGSWDVGILATDISTRALARAKAGLYDAQRVEALSMDERNYALEVAEPGPPRIYRVRDELRRMDSFARLNLMHDWPMKGPFDAVFCRNVMIYFDRPTQERLVNRMAALLRPGGTLYVGHSESLSAITHPLKAIAPATYVA